MTLTLFEYFDKCFHCVNWHDKPTYGNCSKKKKDIIDLKPDMIELCGDYKDVRKKVK